MGMHVNLTPEQEQVVAKELSTGRYQSVEQVIGDALQALRERGGRTADIVPQDAVREMFDFIEENSTRLEGVSIRQLIHEGHRW